MVSGAKQLVLATLLAALVAVARGGDASAASVEHWSNYYPQPRVFGRCAWAPAVLPLAGNDQSGELVVLPRAPTNCRDPTIVGASRAACLRCQAARTRAQCLALQAIVFGGTDVDSCVWTEPRRVGQGAVKEVVYNVRTNIYALRALPLDPTTCKVRVEVTRTLGYGIGTGRFASAGWAPDSSRTTTTINSCVLKGRSQQCGYNYYPISTTRAMLFNRLLWTQDPATEAALQGYNAASCLADARQPACRAAAALAPYRIVVRMTEEPCRSGKRRTRDNVLLAATTPMAEPGTLVLPGAPTLIVRAQYQQLDEFGWAQWAVKSQSARLAVAVVPTAILPGICPDSFSSCDYSSVLRRNAVANSFCEGLSCQGIFVNNATVKELSVVLAYPGRWLTTDFVLPSETKPSTVAVTLYGRARAGASAAAADSGVQPTTITEARAWTLASSATSDATGGAGIIRPSTLGDAAEWTGTASP